MVGMIKPVSNKLLVESAINDYNDKINFIEAENKKREIESRKIMKEQELVVQSIGKKDIARRRYTSFSESLNGVLLGEAIYHIFEHTIPEELLDKPGSKTVMRVMVSDFVTEDAASIIRKMGRSPILSDIYNIVTSTKKKILESIADTKDDPSTFRIAPEIKDEFFDKLDNMETDSITNAIRDRVAGEVNEFIDANKRDHEQILNILQLTKDKLDEKKDSSEEVQESYTNMSRRAITKVRNRKKSVFEAMVSAMCESVMHNDELKEEFTEYSNLNIGKIVDRVQLMYTFLETVSSLNLYKIDENYMMDLIESMRK